MARTPGSPTLRGFLNIDKPPDMTSFDVVRDVRRASGVRRVGHAGTLDRPATGVLPVAVGDCTRLIDTLVDAPKRYEAIVELGVETDTYDAAGEVQTTMDAGGVTRRQIEAALEPFLGEILQQPPAFSAIKVAGERSYKAARRGEEVELKPRPVVVHDLTVRDIEGLGTARPCVAIEVHCGKGFYMRSLAHDLGQTLGVGGHVRTLRRTAVGQFVIANAVPLAQVVALLEADEYEELLHAPDAVLTDWPALILGQAAAADARQGRDLHPRGTAVRRRLAVGTRARAYGPDGLLLALVEAGPAPGVWHPYRVFASGASSAAQGR